MSIENSIKQETFFKLLFGRNKGFVCLSFLDPSDKRDMREEWFIYPDAIPSMLEAIAENSPVKNTYFCPQLFAQKRRVKENVVLTPNAWSDLDTCNPTNLLVDPSIVVESSPGRFQAYWVFENASNVNPKEAEELCRRIAYFHANKGADKSGWDLTQLLRVPFTPNFKYEDAPEVKITEINKSIFRINDFKDYPTLLNFNAATVMDIPKLDPELNADYYLTKHKTKISQRIVQMFIEEPPDRNWSNVLWKLEMSLFEINFKPEEVFAIVREARCNKYARDGRPEIQLWTEVCRAYDASLLNKKLQINDPETVTQLLSQEERAIVDSLEPTIIEDYIEWASTLGDAAKQYHQAGIFTLLSTLLCGSVTLPTSYGSIVPNLWFMILADTTLTRKSTSMDIAMELLEEIDPEAVMATDGSIEGLLTNLANRPKKASVFLRDEFSGMIEAMMKKDYMAGMAETLTKLYDGKMQRRILRKETLEIRDPRLIMYTGGIKNKVTAALTHEHVSSGFMPRFIFVTALSDVSKIKPLGPPTSVLSSRRDAIIAELTQLYLHYNAPRRIEVQGALPFEKAADFKARLTEDAWVRYNKLEYKLVDIGMNSTHPAIFTPVGDRLAKSILKAAILIAASRELSEEIVVEENDILRAIKFGEHWRTYAEEVINAIGDNSSERKLEQIYNIIAGGAGVPRSRLMRLFKLSSREMNGVIDTLTGREQVVVRQVEGKALYYPSKI